MKKQIVFIDESGDAGFNKRGASPYFAFVLVIFDDQEDAEITEVKLQKIAELTKLKTEFKFSKTCNNIKNVFFSEICDCNFRVKSIYINKDIIYSDFLKNSSSYFYNYILKNVLLHAGLTNASVKLDGKKTKFKKELVTYIKRYARHAVKKFSFEDSKNNRLIQLADMIVGLIVHYNSPNATDDQKKWYKNICRKISPWDFE